LSHLPGHHREEEEKQNLLSAKDSGESLEGQREETSKINLTITSEVEGHKKSPNTTLSSQNQYYQGLHQAPDHEGGEEIMLNSLK